MKTDEIISKLKEEVLEFYVDEKDVDDNGWLFYGYRSKENRENDLTKLKEFQKTVKGKRIRKLMIIADDSCGWGIRIYKMSTCKKKKTLFTPATTFFLMLFAVVIVIVRTVQNQKKEIQQS